MRTTRQGLRLEYSIGCMLEVPRACLRADRIAAESHVDFVSFGSNDLTQLVFGFSRDDTQRFMVCTVPSKDLV